jgi:hypothetical protein
MRSQALIVRSLTLAHAIAPLRSALRSRALH